MIHWKVSDPRTELKRVAIPLACALVVLALSTGISAPPLLPRLYFLREDGIVVAGLLALLLAFSLIRFSGPAPRLPRVILTRRRLLVGAALLALLLWAGTYLLFDDYPLSRDEQMVVFDAIVFRHGRLALPLAPEWRSYAEALTPAFLLPLPGNAAWVSSYMPGNAMLRTLFGTILDPALFNPLLAAGGAMATFDCAERLFPGRRGAQLLALLLYVTSAQVLVTAMTPYAMTPHLALNMIWLSLFLRDSRSAHAAAIAIGFVAIGLHQIIFHPLFALPFIDQLRRKGEWRTALAYAGCYAVFGLFWISYPHLVAISAGLDSQAGPAAGTGAFIADRILPLLTVREPQTIPLMEANLLRFVAWQNLALVPLMMLAWPAVRQNEGIARPLAVGIALTLAAMAFLMPYQAIGWGYRYLHGLIGSCTLLAGYGWRDHSRRAEVHWFVLTGTFLTVLGSIPFLAWQAEAFAKPYARVDRMIHNIHADMVVVETQGPVFRIDEVRNRPDLVNRPIRLAGNLLGSADIPILCARGTIAFVDAGQMQALGLGFGNRPDSRHFEALRDAARKHCGSNR
jgi:hypothetical protein